MSACKNRSIHTGGPGDGLWRCRREEIPRGGTANRTAGVAVVNSRLTQELLGFVGSSKQALAVMERHEFICRAVRDEDRATGPRYFGKVVEAALQERSNGQPGKLAAGHVSNRREGANQQQRAV